MKKQFYNGNPETLNIKKKKKKLGKKKLGGKKEQFFLRVSSLGLHIEI